MTPDIRITVTVQDMTRQTERTQQYRCVAADAGAPGKFDLVVADIVALCGAVAAASTQAALESGIRDL